MTKKYQVTIDNPRCTMTEVPDNRDARFLDVKNFPNKIALLRYLYTLRPTQEMQTGWETQLSKGQGFLVTV
jgi:hypothetical protein